jgi:hypothetical protein
LKRKIQSKKKIALVNLCKLANCNKNNENMINLIKLNQNEL